MNILHQILHNLIYKIYNNVKFHTTSVHGRLVKHSKQKQENTTHFQKHYNEVCNIVRTKNNEIRKLKNLSKILIIRMYVNQ